MQSKSVGNPDGDAYQTEQGSWVDKLAHGNLIWSEIDGNVAKCHVKKKKKVKC